HPNCPGADSYAWVPCSAVRPPSRPAAGPPSPTRAARRRPTSTGRGCSPPPRSPGGATTRARRSNWRRSTSAGSRNQNPQITVNLVTAGKNYDEIAQRFQAAAGTDNTPDLVGASDVWWFRYMINGQIIPLDGLAQHLQIDTDDY